MKTKIKRVVPCKTTPNKTQQRESYRNSASASIAKLQIGELLLLLLTEDGQPDGWQRFDRLLRQFYEGGVL